MRNINKLILAPWRKKCLGSLWNLKEVWPRCSPPLTLTLFLHVPLTQLSSKLILRFSLPATAITTHHLKMFLLLCSKFYILFPLPRCSSSHTLPHGGLWIRPTSKKLTMSSPLSSAHSPASPPAILATSSSNNNRYFVCAFPSTPANRCSSSLSKV